MKYCYMKNGFKMGQRMRMLSLFLVQIYPTMPKCFLCYVMYMHKKKRQVQIKKKTYTEIKVVN